MDWSVVLRSIRRSALRGGAREILRRLSGIPRDSVLHWRAIIRRKRYRRVTFIGVTGSCGKTTTTALVGAVLSSAGQCCIGAGHNAHRAVMKNVLSVNASTRFCAQEVSGSSPGRIATHCSLLQPQIGIVTTIGGDHYKNFRSLEATSREKGQLVELLPKTGFAILNADDPYVLALASRTAARVMTFGRSHDAVVRATDVSSAWPNRLGLTVTCGNDTLRIRTKLIGEHWTTSVLAAITCGIACGIDLNDCVKAVENFEPIFGRYSVHIKPDGPVYIFDHKAPFWTIGVSLAFVEAARAPRKTIVFGTISDYPGDTTKRYRRVAREALAVADRVAFVGQQAGHMDRLRQGEAGNRLFTFETSYQASDFLARAPVAGELIFIKGSLTADHLERIVLSQLDRVVCWRERCGYKLACLHCSEYRVPTPPPRGLVDIPSAQQSAVAD